MRRGNLVGFTLAATIVVGACSAAAVPPVAPASPAPAAAAPSVLAPSVPAPSQAPIVAAQPVAPQSLAPAESPVETIHLSLHPINDTVGSLTGCSNPGACQGDFMVGYDPLVDVATGKQAGTFAYECFLVDVGSTLYHCPGVTITLTGRGQIVFTEVIEHEPGKPPAVAPITGGTGEFLGATGEVTARVLSNGGDFVITITK
jgi:hypothetical protein